jgi:chromosomal replication initiation ATPase DnaA
VDKAVCNFFGLFFHFNSIGYLVQNMDQLWEKALGTFKEQFGKQNFDTWIKPLHVAARSKSEIRLDVPNKFFRDWLAEHYVDQLEKVLSSIANHDFKVHLQVNQQLQTPLLAEATDRKDDRTKDKLPRTSNLIPKYTFENFVIGASNQFAHAASMAVANQPGDHYNPLFIYGGVGLGKTFVGLMLIATGAAVATATTEGLGAAVFPMVLVALTAVVAHGRRYGARSVGITVGTTRAS